MDVIQCARAKPKVPPTGSGANVPIVLPVATCADDDVGVGAALTGGVTGGTVAGAVPGQARPVLPPQMLLDDAIATIISPGRCSAAMMEPAQVKPIRTAHTTATNCFFSMRFSVIYLPLP